MGGNLFGLGRLPRDAYQRLEAKLRVYLDDRFGDLYRIPRYYSSKPDFGDVDIIISEAAVQTTWIDLRAQIIADLQITQWTANKSVFSTVFENFQVDYFMRPQRYFLSTYNFLCYNDLGNILGRIFHRMRLKYGEQGLQYVYRRDAGNYRHDLDISLDIDRILAFLELDPAPWHAGFSTLEVMYAWVLTSPYFSSEPYSRPGASTRRRSHQRTTMRRFMAWLEENNIQRTVEYAPSYRAEIERAFPEAGLRAAIEEEDRLATRAAIVREKFNGRMVTALIPSLSGKALGEFIRTLKDQIPDFEAWVFHSSPKEIQDRILSHQDLFT